MSGRRWLLAAVVLGLAVVLAWPEGHSEPPSVTILGSLATVRLDLASPSPEGEPSARLLAARNEFESFQVAVDARSPVKGVRVAKAGPLRGPGGSAIGPGQLTIYREVGYAVSSPSDGEGAVGIYPDALVPQRDYLYGEPRNAFPVDLPTQGKVVAWVDVLVPNGQRPGTYRGAVRVSDASGLVARVPIRLRVFDFTLPSTSSLPSAFSIGAERPCMAQTGARCSPDSPSGWRLGYLYAREALENRVTIPNPAPMASAPHGRRELALFRRFDLPLINGRSAPQGGANCSRDPAAGRPGCLRAPRLRGARLTSVEAYGGNPPQPGEKADYECARASSRCLARWRALARRYGFSGRFFLLLCDEPDVDPASRWPFCRSSAFQVRRSGWPGVRTLVTTSIQEVDAHHAASYIDTLAPNPQEIADKPGNPQAGDQRPRYNAFLAKPRRRLWLYTSCIQYGCGDGPSPESYFIGWPGYGIDQPPSQATAMSWLEFLYRARGELYYAVDRSLGQAWTDQFLSGGNGDGNLFYPGTPSGSPADKDPSDYFPVGGSPAIGGVHPIPIESIRLKRIRDGREDYEYLAALARRGEGAAARRVVAGLLDDGNPETTTLDAATYSTTFSQSSLNRARCELAGMLDRGLHSCP